MNVPISKAYNFLYTSSDENKDDIQEFIKIAAALVKENKKVLLFTRQHVDLMPALAGMSKELMQHFIISYHSDINTLIKKLLELHDWTIFPDFVILNLNSFYDVAGDDAQPMPKPTFSKICFCIATLLNYMRFLRTKGCAKSVTMLNSHPEVNVQRLIDFYYYKMAAFNEVLAVQNEIIC